MKISDAVVNEYFNTTWDGKYTYTYDVGKNDIDRKGAINFYLENLQNSCAHNTLYCYSRDLNFLLEQIGNIKMDSLDEDILNNFITQLCCF
jgi:tRNA U34 5-carboxymethylaminomethyl modifying GTPase MnmE/TrmE